MRHRVLAGACALGLLVLMGATTVSAQPGTEGFQVTGGIEPVDQVDVAKSLTGRLAQTDPSLLGRTSSKLINVIVKLDYDPAAVYAGGLAGLKATSPSVTGRSLDRSAAAVGKYQTYVKGFEARATRAIQAQVPAAQSGSRSTSRTADSPCACRRTRSARCSRRRASRRSSATRWRNRSRSRSRSSRSEPRRCGPRWAAPITRAKASWSRTSTRVSGPRAPCSRTRACRRRRSRTGASSASPVRSNDAAFACNHKLVGAYAFTDTYTTVFGAAARRVLPRHAGFGSVAVFGAGRRRARNPHAHDGRRRLRRQRADVGIDRGPTSGMAPGAHVIALPGVPGPRVLPVRQRRGRQPGHRRRRRRPQLLDQRGRERVLGRRRAGVPRRLRRRGSS